ncbi:MAG: HEPN-type nucleotidyltransferase, antibiotic resistance related protein [candidate division TM6 bacterium GW2011_GWF2_37_49]|nr:MAG: HEPN-type nucleotidyltransferase, antibiotic resistance related protein [candidate division TM6 bacterium GW2011_GWF2_37_49]
MHRPDEWLRIAKEDLAVAKAILNLEFFATVTYHCQQSSEKALKALKAYIVVKNQPILKTHDLEKLLEICLSFDKNFIKLSKIA